MATVTATSLRAAPRLAERAIADHGWRAAAIALLAVRFIQGWIYWGGGSRRFIYGPQKLVPHGQWMAHKFQSAMPGAILGTEHLIAYLLQHFWLLYASIIVFSAGELIAGLLLMAGLFSRLCAALTSVFSIALMLMFGWQGATCMDEWTMAAANLGMGVTLILAGAGAYSLDNRLLARYPALAEKSWFRWLCGSLPLPLSDRGFNRLAFAPARLRRCLRRQHLQLLSRLGGDALPWRAGQPVAASSLDGWRCAAARRRGRGACLY